MKSNEYDISYIRKYLNGELDARSMYQLERQAQHDPLLMDLILGMESGEQKEHEEAIAGINKMIGQRTKRREQRISLLYRWSIAASFLIFCGITAWLLLKRQPTAAIISAARKTVPGKEQKVPHLGPADTVILSERSSRIAALPKNAASPGMQGIRTRQIAEKWPALIKEDQKMAMLGEQKKNDSVKLDEVHITGYAALARTSSSLAPVQLPVPENVVQQSLQGRIAGVSVLRKNKAQQMVSGVVIDKEDHSALAGVSISVKGSSSNTVSDKDGRFIIAVPKRSDSLELSYVGFEKKSLKVGNTDSMTIAMEPSRQSLNEVVVVGYGSQNRMDNDERGNLESEARPLNGWQEFNKYLKDHAVVEKGTGGVVVLSFYVSSTGELRDFQIIKTTNDKLNEKAVRLIKEGPQWLGPKSGSKKVKLRIRFNGKA